MIKLEFSHETDVKVETDPTGRVTIHLTPRFYNRRGMVDLMYIETEFKKADSIISEKAMICLSGATGALRFSEAPAEVEPAFLSADEPKDPKDPKEPADD